MDNNVLLSTLKYNYCIGCGICRMSCPYEAIKMVLTKNCDINPKIDKSKCIKCGICTEYCPHTKEKLLSEIQKVCETSSPNSFGLEKATYLLAHDKDADKRKKSASGGVATALVEHLFKKKIIDGVIHATMRLGSIGELHYEASISNSFVEADRKRSSYYGQIDYSHIVDEIKGKEKTYLVIGVPCAIRALTKLFKEHSSYNKNKIYTLALACSHNVNGQFVDFLAESLGIPKDIQFKANLRNKDNIKDANNYNNHFFNGVQDIVKINRFKSLFTDIWRNYFFSMKVCGYCSDFWGYTADISLKDAWGKWADNPLGDSIAVIRNKKLLDELLDSDNIEYEYLDFETVAGSQLSTTLYKQTEAADRLNKPVWHIDNIRSGYLKHTVLSELSKFCYRHFGYELSKRILFIVLAVLVKLENNARNIENIGFLKRKALIKDITKKADNKRVVFFGTGKMAETLKKAIPVHVEYYVDNDEKKHNTMIDNTIIKDPNVILYENRDDVLIIVASMYIDQISMQLEKMGLIPGVHFIDGRILFENIAGKPKHFKESKFAMGIEVILKPFIAVFIKAKSIFVYEKTKKHKKILVVGGYGYKNTGDEAQLSATIRSLKEEFEGYIIKVLTPNQHYTYFTHGECNVGDAPRVAFYDAGETALYYLDSTYKKLKFIFVSLLVYWNAFFVRAGLPLFLINAKKAALLYEISTSDMIYFSGGGYLTGKTVSRLWDSMFLIRIADIFRVPVFLSGQTIGVWNGSFNKRLSKWGLSKAKLITLRDSYESVRALEEIGISGEHVFSTFDDALFCEKLEDESKINNLLMNSGIRDEQANKGYVAINIHYWGLDTSEEKRQLLEKIDKVVGIVLRKTDCNILFVPMVPSDEEAINDFMKAYRKDRLYNLSYDYDFRTVRALIGGSDICVTMKHHPIIFALGEKVPVISLALGDYYEHKNIGALGIFGLEKCNIILSDALYYRDFDLILDEIYSAKENIIRTIEESYKEVRQKKAYFISRIKEIISNKL